MSISIYFEAHRARVSARL
eukprot:UN15221